MVPVNNRVKRDRAPLFRRWYTTISSFITTIAQMMIITWQAHPVYFVGLLLFTFVQGGIPLAAAWLTKVLFDLLAQLPQHGAGPTLWQTFSLLLVAQAILTILSQMIPLVYQYLSAELGRKLSLKIQTSIYQKINSFVGLSYFEDPSLYNTLQLSASRAMFGPLQSLTILTNLMQGIITIVSFLGVLIALNPLLAGLIVVAILPQFYIQMRFGRQRFDIAFRNSPKERRAMYYSQKLTEPALAKEIRLFNLGEYFLRSFIQITKEMHQDQRLQQKREVGWRSLLSLLTSAVSTGAFIFVALQAFSGQITLGDVILYTSAVTSMQSTLSGMSTSLSQMNEQALFYQQLTNLLALPEIIPLPAAPRPVPPLTTGITLQHVSFRYSEQHPWVLRDITLELPAGRCLALVGLNGAGKTTLVKLLARMYDPTDGRILWDGIDIRKFDPQQLRQNLSTIFQDFAHYDLTVQENIGMGNIASIEDSTAIQKAALKAGIHERIMAFPQHYQSFLGRWLAPDDTAAELSGGEWQKIALARMFMRDAPFLILDEPTSALDAQAEYELYNHFREMMYHKTCLLITHRFSTVRMADVIAVIEDGRIAEQGTHADLIACNGTYARLYQMQAEQYREPK